MNLKVSHRLMARRRAGLSLKLNLSQYRNFDDPFVNDVDHKKRNKINFGT